MAAGVLRTDIDPSDSLTLQQIIIDADASGWIHDVVIASPNFVPHYQPPAGLAFDPEYANTLSSYLWTIFPDAEFRSMDYNNIGDEEQENWYFAMFADVPYEILYKFRVGPPLPEGALDRIS